MEHIHFVGIKGVAMAALAVWAKEKGYKVSGSDVSEEFPTDDVLRKAGIMPFVGFSPEHVSGDLIIYTGAHGGVENIEVKEGQKKNIPVLPHGKALGEFMKNYRQISVAGCHGKTTTTSMIAKILIDAGLDPSYAIGSGEVRGLGAPGHAGKGDWFVAEADEYITDPGHDLTPRFLWQKPEILAITSIDYDHPDAYKSLEDVGQAYRLLADRMDNAYVIFNGDDRNNRKFLEDKSPHFTYGFEQGDLRIREGEQKPYANNGIFVWQEEEIPITLKVPGKHNLLNAAAAFLVAKKIGLETSVVQKALGEFGGASRRFEYIGEKNGYIVIDDYAHHPKEIEATLSAAREWYPDQRITVLFQPHTYSRTKALLHEFGAAFKACDAVGILPIYASARETEKTIETTDVVKEIQKHHSKVSFYNSVAIFFDEILKEPAKHDIILCLGAGDIGRNVRTYGFNH